VAAFGGGLLGIGGGGATGKIYQLSDTQFSDDGAAIPSYYTTHFSRAGGGEFAGAWRAPEIVQLFDYVCGGSGEPGADEFCGFGERGDGAAAVGHEFAGAKDLELPINVLGERVAFQVGDESGGSVV